MIVTYNLKDFPKENLDKYGIEAQHPDEFINHLIDLAIEKVCLVVRQHRDSLKNPPIAIDEYIETLKKHSLPKTVAQLNKCKKYI